MFFLGSLSQFDCCRARWWNPWDSGKKNDVASMRVRSSQSTKGISWYIYIDRFIDEAAPEWTNGISHMCPELLSNGLFHSARKKIQFNNVVMFFTAVFPSTLDPSGGHCKHPLAFCQVEGRRRGTAETFVAAGGRTAGQLLGVADQGSPRGMRSLVHGTKDNGETWVFHGTWSTSKRTCWKCQDMPHFMAIFMRKVINQH